MQLDIRIPVGLMCLLIGTILVVESQLSATTPAMHINLRWGSFMALFGVVCLWLAWRARLKRGRTAPADR